MRIYSIWVSNGDGFGPPWLTGAWDEYSIDENPDGYDQDLMKAREDYNEVRVVVVNIDGASIDKAFHSPEISGVVEDA